jgi:iron complex outermembrane receptor protein
MSTLLRASSVLSLALLTGETALAQASAAGDVTNDIAGLEEITVTGSRILRTDATSPSPISVMSEDDILSSGSLSLSEVLRRDPSLGSGSRGPTNALNGAGAVGVNLRNLGSRRSLVLINGKRYPLYADAIQNASQDISTIPSAMVERVEVLRDGASTTYGADAVAGVVNFILKDDYEGANLEGYYGVSDEGDGSGYRLSGTLGTTFERGSLLFNVQYQDQEGVMQSERGWATNLIQSLAGTGAFNSPNTPGGAVLRANGSVLACYPIEGGANVAPACPRYDASVETSLLIATQLRSVGAVAHYDVTDDIRFNVQTFLSNRQSNQNISAGQIDTSGVTGPYSSGFLIPAANSNNPYGQDVRLRWRPAMYGSRPTLADTEQLWSSFGFTGKLAGRFNWEVAHTYASNKANSRTPNTPDATHLNLLLNPTNCAADPLCRSVGAIANIESLLTQNVPLTAEQQDYLFFTQAVQSKFTTAQTLATISGPLLELPAGPLQAAVGLERREETGFTEADAVSRSGAAIGSFIFPTDGEFTTKEIFAELDIPLLANLPGVQQLDLNLQGRYSDFSNFGGADTYKAGLNYTPVDAVRIRAAYGTSFRAPDVIELYGGGTGTNGQFQDPCNAGGLRASNAVVETNCAALGVPGSFQQPTASLPQRSGGNPDLKPEEGETYTFGIVLQPRLLEGFTASIDYYKIEITDAVSTSGALLQNNLNNCYADPNFLTRAQNVTDGCFSFNVRTPGGALGRVENRRVNIAEVSTSGVDTSMQYRFDDLGFAPGYAQVDLRGSWLESYEEGGREFAGLFVGSVDGASAYPRWRGYLDLTYGRNTWSAQWTLNYVQQMTDSNYGSAVPANNFKGYSGTPNYYSHDALFRWTPTDDVRVLVGVNNVTDKDPPYAFVSTRNALSTVHDNLGRYFFTSLSKSF